MERLKFALRAAWSVAAALSNLLPIFAVVLWYAAENAEFRRGFVLAAGSYAPTTATVWKMMATMILVPALFVFVAAFSRRESINAEAINFGMRYHVGRVYILCPLRFARRIANILFLPTPR